jgi:Methyltransferase domain
VLDIGSGSLGIAKLLGQRFQTTLLDADFTDYGAASGGASGADRVRGDVRALPFGDRAFDVAIAVDLLEHLPAGDRLAAVSEICRVAGRLAVIAGPSGEEALAADRRLAEALRAKNGSVPPWLEEHLENGFPEYPQLATAASRFGAVQLFENESIAAHTRLITAELSLIPGAVLRLASHPIEHLLVSRRRRSRRCAAAILRQIRGRDRPPNYRAVVAVDTHTRGQSPAGRPVTSGPDNRGVDVRAPG